MANAIEIRSHLLKNFLILAVSIGAAIFFAKAGIFEDILSVSKEIRFLGNFLAGVFFTSVLTIGPATVALGELAQMNSLILVSLVGAAGAVIGDLIIFRFVRDRITDDFIALFEQPKIKRISHLLRLEIFRWFLPLLGALIVASPLPDEIGLAMMGLSKIKTRYFIPLSFSLNFFGILVVGIVARGLV